MGGSQADQSCYTSRPAATLVRVHHRRQPWIAPVGIILAVAGGEGLEVSVVDAPAFPVSVKHGIITVSNARINLSATFSRFDRGIDRHGSMMETLIPVLISLVASVVLTIGKAVMSYRRLGRGVLGRAELLLMAVALVILGASLRVSCRDAGCSAGVSLGWLWALTGQGRNTPIEVIVPVFGLLAVYGLGNLLALLAFGARNLLVGRPAR